jgi:predicted ester cyclase
MGSRVSLTVARGVMFLALLALAFPLTVMAQAPEENKAFVREYMQAISGQEKATALLEEYISDEALIQHILDFEAAFPRYEFLEEDMIAEGDRVAVRGTSRGTHEGEFFGIEPTGRQVEISGIIIYRIEGGRIAEHWMQVDVMGLMQQLTEEGEDEQP